jgi:hypothetical protein
VEQVFFNPGQENRAAGMIDADMRDQSDPNQAGPEQTRLSKIADLPKEVGVMLLTAGVVGFILPGPGTPAIIAGGLVLWPEAFGKLESWLKRSHPQVHRQGIQQINRFLDDLEKRYPGTAHEKGGRL